MSKKINGKPMYAAPAEFEQTSISSTRVPQKYKNNPRFRRTYRGK